MTIKADDNPFQPGAGHVPEPLLGRDKETELLTLVLNRLASPRAGFRGALAKTPYSPVRIVGPRGLGKTALLGWAEKQAKKRGIRCVSCEGLKSNEEGHTMHELLANVSIVPRLLQRLKGGKVDVPGKVGAGVELDQSRPGFASVAGLALWFKPLLLLLDEVQSYEMSLLREVLLGSQRLISDGYPLGLVLAGTPGLDSHLAKAEATFITRSKHIYINTLSDAATRAALQKPFEQEKITVAPEALEAMAAQTDNYPFFIQLVGGETWNELARSGRKEVDVELVGRIEKQAREGREEIYAEAFDRIANNNLLPQARQVMEAS
ncbi:MAG: ATP-binding protein [Betaproteobacteria bacterium AqS2]|uniref:ATP-binding protein n=1 Tax=Candidatus Amphirhobacter heronislandensis TaxID=1732024 RepID=A0A930UB78_9GAMM|nr:ATP-binding protein [Betaproteobacteria bacterium AqS2]